MIEIEAVLDGDGILRACTASGHAGADKTGNDIVCAAVTVLMRTAVRVLSSREGITLRWNAPEPGFIDLETDCEAGGRDFLSAAGVFLLNGLESVAEEYPQYCTLTLRRT